MSNKNGTNRLKGLDKYPSALEEGYIEDERYFPFPGHVFGGKLDNKDLSVLLGICYHINTFDSKSGTVYEESIDRLAVSLKKTKRSRFDIVKHVENLESLEFIEIDGDINGSFNVVVYFPKGYSPITYGEFGQVVSMTDGNPSNVHALFLAITCSQFIKKDSISSYVFRKNQVALMDMTGLSKKTCQRIIADLEKAKIVATYNVRLMDSVKQKMILSKYRHRDKLKMWLVNEINTPYGEIFGIISKKEKNDIEDK